MNNPLFSLPLIDKAPSWDCLCMSLAFLVSTRSKDPNTKVGACLLMDDKTIYLGYNGCPEHFDDSLLGTKDKYSYVIHAEDNALSRAGRELCRRQQHMNLYLPFKPCPKCALKIADYRVKRVVYFSEYKSNLNDEALLEQIRCGGHTKEVMSDVYKSVFRLEKYTAEPLLFHHAHFGIR